MSQSISLLGVPGNTEGAVSHITSLPPIDATASYTGCFQGALNTTAILISLKFSSPSKSVRIFYSKSSNLSNFKYTRLFQTDSYGWVKIPLTSLDPNTTYHWSAVNDSKRSSVVCSFKTLADSYAAFKIALSCCAQNNSNNTVFTTIRNEAPLLFQHMGDLHYAEIGTDDVNLFRLQYENIFTLSNQRSLYQTTPLFYIWDDNDFGINNSSASSVSRAASRNAYRSFIPSPPLASPTYGAIYYSYRVGNVLFIVTDNRSERSDPGVTDNSSKTVLGTEQKTWFKSLLLSAKNSNYRGIIWINSFPWLGSAFSDDEWAFYATERTELSTYIKENQIPLLAIVCGDAHMIAVDNGSANEAFGVPTYQFGALDQTGNVKGAGYSHGTFAGTTQYGILEFTNAPSYLQLTGTGKNSGGTVISRHRTFATKWMAFNDCYGRSSAFTRVTNRNYAVTPATTNLIDYKTGNTLSAMISCVVSGTGYVIDPSITADSAPPQLNDLYDRFKNTISFQYTGHEVTASSTFTINLTELDTTKYYLIECSSDRAVPTFNNLRGVTITINDYSEIVNLSSAGVIVNSVNSISYSSGYNTVYGYIARWAIKPLSTNVNITSNYDAVNYPSGSKGYAVKFLCVSELL